jgi:hypothetical protein
MMMMKLRNLLPLTIVALSFATEAYASETQVELTAYVPTSCSMQFSQKVERLSSDSFSLGMVDQFCNTNYQLRLYHAEAPAGSQFRFGERTVDASSQSTLLESSGRPVIGSTQLIARGLDEASANTLGWNMVLEVTPLAL